MVRGFLMIALSLGPAALAPDGAGALTAEEMIGDYEQVDRIGNTCEANPAHLSVLRHPDHIAFDWPVPMTVFDGSVRRGVTYDLLEERPDALALRLEGETRQTEAGEPVIWLLRPDATLGTFCWGRTDWPVTRCEGGMRRCRADAPTS